MEWPVPCRARKATRVPEGSAQMVMGELGKPQGWAAEVREGLREKGRTYCLGVDVLTGDDG